MTARKRNRLLTTQKEVIALDPKAHLALLIAALGLTARGKAVAKITKGYPEGKA